MRSVPSQISARLPAAAELFADQGLDDTKIEQVAAATGIPKATLYYYFASKEEILAFLLHDTLLSMSDEVAIATASEGSAAERLGLVIDAQLRVMADQPAVCRALVGDLGRAARMPTVAQMINSAYTEPVEALLKEGAQDGSLVEQTQPTAAAMALFGAVAVTGLSQLATGRPLEVAPLAETIRSTVLDGLRPRP